MAAAAASRVTAATTGAGTRSCASRAAAHGHVPSSPSSLEAARRVWRATVEGCAEHRAPPASTLYRWMGKMTALHYLRSAAPHVSTTGRFDDLEGDVACAAPHCLQFLSEGLSSKEGERGWRPGEAAAVEAALGQRLQDMVETLTQARSTWWWEVTGIHQAWVERVFIIFGVSRTRTLHRGPIDIISGFGNQFVVGQEQAELYGRVGAAQKSLDSDMVVVADVIMQATQRSAMWCPDHDSAGALSSEDVDHEPNLGDHNVVEHILRLEMALSQEWGQFGPGTGQVLRAGPWQIADWNGLCRGNHPALQHGEEAPW